jgi:hypothetical protein
MASRSVSEGHDSVGESGIEGDGNQLADVKYMCFACEQYDFLNALPACKSARMFHTHCWAGCRSYVRSLGKDSATQTEYKHTFIHDPVGWRSDVRPFLSPEPEDRAAARGTLKRKFYETASCENVQAQEDISDDLLLNRIYFRSHVGFWERLDDKEADAKFDSILVEQRRKHCKAGKEDLIAYEAVAKIRNRSGQETRSGLQTREGLPEQGHVAKLRRLSSKTHFPPAPSCTSSSAPQVSSFSTTKPPTSTPQADLVDAVTPRKQNARTTDDEAVRLIAPSALTPKQLLIRQELMHEDCNKLLVMLAGPRGIITLLNQTVKCLDPVALRAEINAKTLPSCWPWRRPKPVSAR